MIENYKLHSSLISWMVHLLVRGGTEAPSDSWDNEFHLLSHEVMLSSYDLIASVINKLLAGCIQSKFNS